MKNKMCCAYGHRDRIHKTSFSSYLKNESKKLVLHYTGLESFASVKTLKLIGPICKLWAFIRCTQIGSVWHFVSVEKNLTILLNVTRRTHLPISTTRWQHWPGICFSTVHKQKVMFCSISKTYLLPWNVDGALNCFARCMHLLLLPWG